MELISIPGRGEWCAEPAIWACCGYGLRPDHIAGRAARGAVAVRCQIVSGRFQNCPLDGSNILLHAGDSFFEDDHTSTIILTPDGELVPVQQSVGRQEPLVAET